jgi:hypothetical protein
MSVPQAQPIALKPAVLTPITIHIDFIGSTPEAFTEVLDLPEGWRTLLPLEVVHVLPGSSLHRSHMITIPQSEPPGVYEVMYQLQSATESFRQTIAVTVLSDQRLQIVPQGQVDAFIPADESGQWSLRIINHGNVSADLQVQHQLSVRGHVEVVPNRFTVPAQSYQDVDLWVTPQPTVPKPTMATLRIDFTDS